MCFAHVANGAYRRKLGVKKVVVISPENILPEYWPHAGRSDLMIRGTTSIIGRYTDDRHGDIFSGNLWLSTIDDSIRDCMITLLLWDFWDIPNHKKIEILKTCDAVIVVVDVRSFHDPTEASLDQFGIWKHELDTQIKDDTPVVLFANNWNARQKTPGRGRREWLQKLDEIRNDYNFLEWFHTSPTLRPITQAMNYILLVMREQHNPPMEIFIPDHLRETWGLQPARVATAAEVLKEAKDKIFLEYRLHFLRGFKPNDSPFKEEMDELLYVPDGSDQRPRSTAKKIEALEDLYVKNRVTYDGSNLFDGTMQDMVISHLISDYNMVTKYFDRIHKPWWCTKEYHRGKIIYFYNEAKWCGLIPANGT